MSEITNLRSPEEVFRSHLELASRHEYRRDIDLNFSKDVVILSSYGVHRGHKGVLDMAELLEDQLPGAEFRYDKTLIEGNAAFLEWSARTSKGKVEDGVDSFFIDKGKIVAQTIHYTYQSFDTSK